MRKIRSYYSEEFKLSVLRDYYSLGMSQHACTRKYSLCNASLIGSWLKKYDLEKESLPLEGSPSESSMANRNKESYQEENAALKKRIRELEKALQFSKQETMVRDMLIDKAEEYFNIPIRKKSGAK